MVSNLRFTVNDLINQAEISKNDEKNLKKIFTSTNLNDDTLSVQINITNKTLFDKDDYPQLKKQESKLVNSAIDQVNDDIQKTKEKLDEIQHLTTTQILTDLLVQMNALNKSKYINHLEELELLKYQIENQFNKSKTFVIPLNTISCYHVLLNINSLKTMINRPNSLLQSTFIHQYFQQEKEHCLIIHNKQNDLYKSARDIIERIGDENTSFIRLGRLIHQLKKILYEFYQCEYYKNLLLSYQFLSSKEILPHLLQIFGYEQKSPSLFSAKINRQGLKYSLSSKLQNLRKRFVQRVFYSRKNNGKSKYKISLENRIIDKNLCYQVQVSDNNCSSRFVSSSSSLNKKSKFTIPSFSSNPSRIDIHTFCGQTYDRSTSAYTSKKRSHRPYFSYTRIKDERDQSTPANILSRVAEKLDENEMDFKDNRDYLAAPNTFKYQNDYVNKSSKYKHSSPQKQSSNSSDIYIKLSDCQTACRRWAAKHNKRDRFSSHARPHYRHRKTKLPICYRNFPSSLNALSKYNNTRKRYTDHRLISQVTSGRDMQTNISVDIRKVSCKKIHSNRKIHDSFICCGTGSVDFVDGPNGSILRLKQRDSKKQEEICLYRRSSSNQLDFGDGHRDEQKQYQPISEQAGERVIDSPVSLETDDESSFNSVFKQFSVSSLASAHMLREENDFDTPINLEISPLDELVTCTTHQNPLEATMLLDVIPACILTVINCLTRMSIIQMPSLPSIVSESDAASLVQHKSVLNLILTDDVKIVQVHQEVAFDGDNRDQSNILDNFTDLENQNHVVMLPERDNIEEPDQGFHNEEKNEKGHLSSNQEFEPLSSTSQLLLEKNTSISNVKDEQSIILNKLWDGNELLLHRHAPDLPKTRTMEEQGPPFIVDDDQNENGKNLTDSQENNRDLHLTTVITSNLPIGQSFEIATTFDEKNGPAIIFDSKISTISLISDHLNHGSVSEREGDEIAYSNASLLTSTSFLTKQDQLLENFEDSSIVFNEFDSEIPSSLTEQPHSLKSNKIFESLNDLSINSLRPADSPISTSYIDGIRSTSGTNQYSRLDEATITTLSREEQQTLDESHITTPKCVHLHDLSEQMINQGFDALLSTAAIPNYSSTSLETKTPISYNKKSTFPSQHVLQNSDDEYESPQIDVYQYETNLSKPSPSRTGSSGLKYPPLVATSLSKIKTSIDSTDLHSSWGSSEPLSIQTDSPIHEFDNRKQSNDKLKVSRIMTIPRESIDDMMEDNDSNLLKKQRRYYVKNQLSDFQTDEFLIGSSSPILTNPVKCKQKNKLAVVPTKSARRQNLIRKKQLCIRPSWVSSNKTSTATNRYRIKTPMNQTSVSLKQLNDPCEILELYTRLKRIYCQPYQCVRTPLPQCCNISPCSFIKNAHICNEYLTHNNKI